MRSILFCAVLFLSLTAANAQKKTWPDVITVKGSVQFVEPKEENNVVRLYKAVMDGNAVIIDSAKLTESNKTFSFRLKQDHPGIYQVRFSFWDQASFWSDADVEMNMRGYDTAKMKIKIPTFNFVKGSADNNFINLYEQIGQLNYLRMIDEYNEEYYAKQHKEKDSAWITYLQTRPRYDSLQTDYRKRLTLLTQMYDDRPVLLYHLRSMTGAESSAKFEEALTSLEKLIKLYPWLTEAKEARAKILKNRELSQKIQPGQPLPVVSYPDNKGKLQGLQKYKGKYLLIDFWASWCGPCRQAIPKVKELYNEFKPSGFEVVSVSIDDSKAAWEKAMKEENMPWEQLLSNNKEETMKTFQFGGIPTLYLIDPDGNIINKYTGYSAEAEEAIKDVLRNKKKAPKRVVSMPAMGF